MRDTNKRYLEGFTPVKSKKYLAGFTLIELIVVMAIIALLATIIFINILAARGRANNASILSSLNGVQKVAAQCVYADFYLWGTVTAAIPPVGLLTFTPNTDICRDPSIVGKWPIIDMKSSNGRKWAMDPLSQGPVTSATKGTTLSVQAVTNVGGPYVTGDFAINCTLTGCVKEQFDSTKPVGSQWTGTVTW